MEYHCGSKIQSVYIQKRRPGQAVPDETAVLQYRSQIVAMAYMVGLVVCRQDPLSGV
jgi:hypothetical protein